MSRSLFVICTDDGYACDWKGEILNKVTGELKTYLIEKTVKPPVVFNGNGVSYKCIFISGSEDKTVGKDTFTAETASVLCAGLEAKQWLGTTAARVSSAGKNSPAESRNIFLYDNSFEQAYRISVDCK